MENHKFGVVLLEQAGGALGHRLTARIRRKLLHVSAKWLQWGRAEFFRDKTFHGDALNPELFYFGPIEWSKVEWSREYQAAYSEAVRRYLVHEYNILGSGWKSVDRDQHKNIDWQQDFRSGYRWNSKQFSKFISTRGLPGTDIKVPWELARMQHLPQLAVYYSIVRESNPAIAQSCVAQFKSQILDFCDQNKCPYGVNWVCTMDVGIRAANWLLAWDLFITAGAGFDADFISRFSHSIFTHAEHISENLENKEAFLGNHFLADVVGLLFCASYLREGTRSNLWLKFSISEVLRALETQFLPDGGNFEASSSYHRLSAEMAVFGAALILGLPEERWRQLFSAKEDNRAERIPGALAKKLLSAMQFTQDTTKPNGQVVQIGDNDSGRLFKLQPSWTLPGLDENVLDHQHLLNSIAALFETTSRGNSLDRLLIQNGRRSNRLAVKLENSSQRSSNVALLNASKWDSMRQVIATDDQAKVDRFEIALPPHSYSAETARYSAYPNFGLYIVRNDRIFLSVRCGNIGQNGIGGHAHNDQLSIELTVDGKDWICDPGTYCYTPYPEIRNKYRSARAHFVPRPSYREPSGIDQNLFALSDDPKAECQYFGPNGFLGRHFGYGFEIVRMIEFLDSKIVVSDYSPHAAEWPDRGKSWSERNPQITFSPGYGCLKNS